MIATYSVGEDGRAHYERVEVKLCFENCALNALAATGEFFHCLLVTDTHWNARSCSERICSTTCGRRREVQKPLAGHKSHRVCISKATLNECGYIHNCPGCRDADAARELRTNLKNLGKGGDVAKSCFESQDRPGRQGDIGRRRACRQGEGKIRLTRYDAERQREVEDSEHCGEWKGEGQDSEHLDVQSEVKRQNHSLEDVRGSAPLPEWYMCGNSIRLFLWAFFTHQRYTH